MKEDPEPKQPQEEEAKDIEHAPAAPEEPEEGTPGPVQRVENAPGVPGEEQEDVRDDPDALPENRAAGEPESPFTQDTLTQRTGRDAGAYQEESAAQPPKEKTNP